MFKAGGIAMASLIGRLFSLRTPRKVTVISSEATDAGEKLKRPYRQVEDSLENLDEVLQDRLNAAKAALERAI